MGASSHLSRQGGSVMIRHVGSVFILGSLCPQASCFLLPQLPSARRLAPPILVPEACPWDHTPQQGIGVRRIMNMVSREPEQVRIEDRDVPVAHRGLHGFLYGNEEDHGATANDAPVEIFDGSSLYQDIYWGKKYRGSHELSHEQKGDPHYQLGQPEGGLNIAKAYLKNNKELERGKDVSVSEWLEANVESKHAAVYAVVGKDGTFNFVGVSRNVALTLAGHVKDQGQDKVYQVKVRSFKYPKRDIMGAMQEEWIRECGYIPEGNLPGREWATSLRDVQAAMSTSQREVYEENKLKMRKAMADPDLINEMEQVRTWNLRKDKESLFYFGRQQMSDEEIELRRRLENAMEGDDWSSVIESQTKLTESTPQETQVPSAAISSPFAASGDMAAQGLDEAVPSAPTSPAVPIVLECKDLEFTVENVDKVLDEVRPYLVADGGNVKVMGVDVEARVVKLALQGACGSCPSSTTTMKMGIERVLRENFRDMGEVQQVDEASGSAMGELSVAVVEAILEPLRPAMVAMRAKVEVLSALDGNVRLSFSGHRKVSYGIKMALMDHPLIRQVDFEFVE